MYNKYYLGGYLRKAPREYTKNKQENHLPALLLEMFLFRKLQKKINSHSYQETHQNLE